MWLVEDKTEAEHQVHSGESWPAAAPCGSGEPDLSSASCMEFFLRAHTVEKITNEPTEMIRIYMLISQKELSNPESNQLNQTGGVA